MFEARGLQDLRNSVDAAGQHAAAQHPRLEPSDRSWGNEQQGDECHQEPDGQEVSCRHAIEKILDQEERRTPHGRDRQQRCRGEAWPHGQLFEM